MGPSKFEDCSERDVDGQALPSKPAAGSAILREGGNGVAARGFAARRESSIRSAADATIASAHNAKRTPLHPPSGGTVVLDVEQGGIVVPSFIGKSVRAAIEIAEQSGLDLDTVGSGLAHEQTPPPGLTWPQDA